MGHLSGEIADIVLTDPRLAKDLEFLPHKGAYVRRRFTLGERTLRREHLCNIAFWADNPPFHAADHWNGALSLVWLALAIKPIGRLLCSESERLAHVGPPPQRWLDHVANVARSPFAAVGEISRTLWSRYVSYPPQPGFLLRSDSGRYPLHYHAEQSSNSESRVRLSERLDAVGMPLLDVDLRFDQRDPQSVLRAHRTLDKALRFAGLARLEFYDASEAAAVDRILTQAADGFHQIGATRMGRDPGQSVVDPDCRVHGVDNLHIASSSVFPSSGQADPTFLSIALAFRLAARLASQRDAGSRLARAVHAVRPADGLAEARLRDSSA
jgi:hypothetical protein